MKAKSTYKEMEKKIVALEEQIAQCRSVENALMESEKRFRFMFENANIGMCIVDTDGRFVQVNKKITEILGYEQKDVIGMNVNDITHPEDSAISSKIIFDSMTGNSSHAEFEKRYLHKKGHIVWGQVTSSLIKDENGTPLYFVSQIKNITEHKIAENDLKENKDFLEKIVSSKTSDLLYANEQLKIEIEKCGMAQEKVRQSEERYALAVSGSTDGIWDWDIVTDKVFYSDRFRELLGSPDGEIPDTVDAFRIRIHPEDADAVWAAVERHLNERVPYKKEYRLRMTSGEYRWILARGQAIWNNEGKAIRFSGSIHDITEQKLAEVALRESEMNFRIVADNTYDWEWWRDTGGIFIYMSPSCMRITQYEREKFMADPDLLWEIIHPDDKSAFFSHLIEVEQTDSPGEIEFRVVRPDGSIRWIAHACQSAFDDQGRRLGRRGSNRDITDRKTAEQKLLESEKQLRHLSVQLLAAQETERRRISRELHDGLGGDLALLKLRCSVIKKKLGKENPLQEECKQNLKQIDDIIDHLRRLSMDLSPSILEDLGLTHALRWLINNFIKLYNIQIEPQIIDMDHLLSKNDQTMIYRIFQEALTNIGKHAQAKTVTVKVNKGIDAINIIIEDDGKGFNMKINLLKNISKKGLGLSTMTERAKLLKGFLDLWSEEGKGTRITLTVPLTEGVTD
jgi:PAS domain S-box-containing protein